MVGRACPSVPGCRCQGRRAGYIYMRILSIFRRFYGSEAGHACPKRVVVRVPAYIRGALRTTLPTFLVPAIRPGYIYMRIAPFLEDFTVRRRDVPVLSGLLYECPLTFAAR